MKKEFRGNGTDGSRANWHNALLGMGGNIGDVLGNMRSALAALAACGQVELIASSSVYKTPPWGVEDQPVFLNSCVAISTSLKPKELLGCCQAIENSLKRSRSIKWGPRTIDLDILMYEDHVSDTKALTIPHPQIINRPFVLVPLAEIAGDWMLEGKTIGAWRNQCDASGIEKIAGGEIFKDVFVHPRHKAATPSTTN